MSLRAYSFLAGLAALVASPAAAQSTVATGTWSAGGDVRLTAADGERSWLDGGLGKLGSERGVNATLGRADLSWQPRFGWDLSGVVVGTLQGGPGRITGGISQAYLAIKPLQGGRLRWSGRLGLLWPPVSLEHGGADWHVTDTITPSAINSWIGEEVRPAAVEASLTATLGEHRLVVSGAAIAANDTAGALLTYRGWALHDRVTLAGRAQPLAILSEEIEAAQPHFTHPLLDVKPGFARRPGYYGRLGWSPPLPFHLELFHYDNRGDPEAVNADLEWGWRTRFTNLGAVVDLAPATRLKVQALTGRTRMGLVEDGRIWIDNRFRSAFALLVHDLPRGGVAARVEAFGTRNRGRYIDDEYDERGWAATLAGHRELTPATSLWLEAIHIASRREQREDIGLEPSQSQDQLQASLRFRW
ncbi:hypothetical protein HMF7854_13565 [Sphingomonas ginkgonis]|uniref:Uncharacterized protein n=1 Tax=Sphingomonas ginkgonis TaxID=2315330 RepID=A0A429VD07_9SPHN|nr:hypothetical protein [Sphingomonas ginkgonis]RST31751.1 hypothetical protein HMF7854_13565 [Sphingomonas ginkgonis]